MDLAAVRTVPVSRRPNKVSAAEFAHPPGADRSFHAFLDSLPDVLVARDFRAVIDALADAARRKRGVVVMLGGHVVKTGLAPLLIDLMRRGVITHLAMNGSAAIHDYEVARFGATSEDVAAGLRDRNRLTAPGMMAGLEGAGQKVQQAELCLRDDLRPEISKIKRKHASRHLARERDLA